MTDRTSVRHVIERLEPRGLVVRLRSDVDRRRSEIIITVAGRKLLARATTSPTVELTAALQRLPVAERVALARGLMRLAIEMRLERSPAPLLFADTPEGARAPTGPIGGRGRAR